MKGGICLVCGTRASILPQDSSLGGHKNPETARRCVGSRQIILPEGERERRVELALEPVKEARGASS